jgi:sugar/nucleoside kinase (ribokinase family)
VVCLDTVMIDFALVVAQLPERGGDSLASRRLVTAGGGYNVMSAARRQGLDALYVGQLGEGPFADLARAIVVGEGIEVAVGPRGGRDLGVCVVLVEESGERTFVTSPGAELTLLPEDLAAVSLEPGDVVYVSGYNVVYPEVARTVSEWLGAVPSGVVVAFDPGPRAADIEADVMVTVLDRTDWLLCNAAEARHLSGRSTAQECARALHDRGGYSRVVVRDGAAGCAVAGDDIVAHAPGYAVTVVDTNGAGDVHNGVVIAEWSRGTPLEESLRRANAAAAIAISTFGPATCPTREVVDRFLVDRSGDVTSRS